MPAGAGERFAGEEWMVLDGRDVAGDHRTIARILQSSPVRAGAVRRWHGWVPSSHEVGASCRYRCPSMTCGSGWRWLARWRCHVPLLEGVAPVSWGASSALPGG